MMPLFFMERLILESLSRQAKNEVALAKDTALTRDALNHILARLAARGLIVQDAAGVRTNLAAREKLIDLLSGANQKQNEIQDLWLQLGQQHLKTKFLRTSWHLKKVYLQPRQITHVMQLLQAVQGILATAEGQDEPHALHEEFIFTWAAGKCSDFIQDVMTPVSVEGN